MELFIVTRETALETYTWDAQKIGISSVFPLGGWTITPYEDASVKAFDFDWMSRSMQIWA